MRGDIIAVRQHAQHPGLHVRIFFLTGQWRGFQNLTGTINHNCSWLRPEFCHQIPILGQRLHGANFLLLPLIRPHNLARLAIHLRHAAFGKSTRGINRQQHIAVRQHPAITCRQIESPLHFAVFSHDHDAVSFSHTQKRMGHSRRRR